MVNGKAVEGILQWLGHTEKKATTRRRKKDAEDTGEEPRPKVGRATKELVDNALKEARQEQLRGVATTRNALRFGTQEVAPKTAPSSAPPSTARPAPTTEGAKKRPAAAAVQALRSIARAGVSANTPPKRRAAPMPTKAKPRCEEESSESSAPAAAADSSEESSDGEDETEVASPSQTAASSSKKAPRPVVAQEENGLQASDSMKIDPKRITEVRSPTGATFQDAVLERLKTLCGDIDDATVLSEYVVVMCAGNKSREEMVGELVPFFSDKGQAQAFIQWVEECKWKFLIGLAGLAGGLSGASVGPPSSRSAEVQPAAGPKAKAAHVESPSGAPGQAKPQAASAQKQPVFQQQPPAPVQPGPHVAVTSKCVLQPNPQFEAAQQQHLQATSVFTQAQPAKTARARAAVTAKAVEDVKHPATVGPAFSKPATVAKVPAAKMSGHAQSPGKQKTDLLESMTKQLQLILTKLNDQGLTDEVREKYQSMAQTLQAQMTKITKPAVGKGRR